MGRTATHRLPARSIARTLPGARPAPHPGYVAPCLATLKPEVPPGPRWLHEVKFDGYRAQAHLKDGTPSVFTRSGYDWTKRFQPIADALARLPADQLVLDGEVVVPNARGVPEFSALQDDLASSRKDRMLYYAFDLLYLDGFDLRGAPLVERKRALAELLAGDHAPIIYSEHFEQDGAGVFERCCAMGLEGVVSKLRDAPYRSGRGDGWVKVKCSKRGVFPIVVFVEKLRPSAQRACGAGRAQSVTQQHAAPAKPGPSGVRIERQEPYWVRT